MREQLNKVSPVSDWRMPDVPDALRRNNCPLPPEYECCGRSVDGVDFRFLDPIRRHAQADHAQILDWIPLADLEVFRQGLTR